MPKILFRHRNYQNKEENIPLSIGLHQRSISQVWNDCKELGIPLTRGFKPTVEDLETDESMPYRELIGSLMYLVLATRPDIAHAVSVLSQFNR